MALSPDEIRRYAHHLTLPEVGIEGQKRIRATRVVCVGTGGLGSPIASYLAAAGIGQLGMVDFDQVESRKRFMAWPGSGGETGAVARNRFP